MLYTLAERWLWRQRVGQALGMKEGALDPLAESEGGVEDGP